MSVTGLLHSYALSQHVSIHVNQDKSSTAHPRAARNLTTVTKSWELLPRFPRVILRIPRHLLRMHHPATLRRLLGVLAYTHQLSHHRLISSCHSRRSAPLEACSVVDSTDLDPNWLCTGHGASFESAPSETHTYVKYLLSCHGGTTIPCHSRAAERYRLSIESTSTSEGTRLRRQAWSLRCGQHAAVIVLLVFLRILVRVVDQTHDTRLQHIQIAHQI